MKQLLVFGAALLLVSPASGATLKVPSGRYPNIQAAVNAANPGDVIQIGKQVYRGKVKIKNQTGLTLAALNGAVIDRGGVGTALLIINCDGIEVRNLSVRNSGKDDGIVVEDSTNILLDSVKVSNSNDHGIRFRQVYSSSILDSKVTGILHDGIHVEGDDVLISGNTIIKAKGDGIGVAGSNNTVEDNFLKRIGDDGVQLGDGFLTTEFNLAVDNRLKRIGRLGGSNGIKLALAASCSAIDNSINGSGGTGIVVDESDDSIVSGNTVNRAGGHGIGLENSSRVSLISNSIDKAKKKGVSLSPGSNDTLLLELTITNSKTLGLHINSDNNIVIGCSATQSGSFDLRDSTNSSVLIDNNFPKVSP